MNPILTFPLWAQQGQGIGEFIGVIVFLLIVFFQFLKTVFEARKGEAASAPPPRSRQEQSTEKRQQPARRERESRPAAREAAPTQTQEEQRNRGVLSRELAPQGVGQRFDVDPGTLDTSHLENASLEPTVRPTLDSMTGIYEAAPVSEESPDQPLTLDIQRLMARPEGVRQAIILAEILKRPDYEDTKFSLR